MVKKKLSDKILEASPTYKQLKKIIVKKRNKTSKTTPKNMNKLLKT